MLVLTRKEGERIQVGDNISILVMDVKGKQVRLGITAPADVKVYREEIFKRIKEENINASNINPSELDRLKSMMDKKG